MRAARICTLLCALVFLFGLAGSLWLLRGADAEVVEILQDGEVLYRFDLSQMQQEERIEIACDSGSNTVLVGPEGVRVERADCADQTCVEMGELTSALPIVCLPHRLVIRYAEGAAEGGSAAQLDGATW